MIIQFGFAWFGLLRLKAYQPLLAYFMPNPVYAYISSIYEL